MNGDVPEAGGRGDGRRIPLLRSTAILMIAAAAFMSTVAEADEGGVSFWIPGLFGSLAAAPQQPGFSLATIYYHTSVSAGGDVALAREIEARRIPVTVTATLNAKLDATGDIVLFNPNYVFATPILGGQASVGLLGMFGRSAASVNGALTGTVATPFGAIPFSRFDNFSDHVWGFGDLAPQASLRWNAGVHNS
jgi:hypothetical protein